MKSKLYMSSMTTKCTPESDQECDKIQFCDICELEFKKECFANIRAAEYNKKDEI